jgi:NADH-quinone oxidoreductase subunit N
VIGNLIAIAQTNLKRMLAYSTVSHVGFLLMGLAGGGERRLRRRAVLRDQLRDHVGGGVRRDHPAVAAGLRGRPHRRLQGPERAQPVEAGLVLCVMASLAGVPPFLGFWAKLVVLRAAIEGGMLWLAIVGVVCAVIGAFYYLRVIKVMYFDEPVGEPRCPPRTDRVLRVVFGVNALALLALGVFWKSVHGVVPAGVRLTGTRQ